MGYPYDKTYLERIQESDYERQAIRNAYWVLRKKFVEDNKLDGVSLDLKQEFALLGEAFQLESDTLAVPDVYHFMWDVLDALLEKESDSDTFCVND